MGGDGIGKFIDLTGQKFGRLTVMRISSEKTLNGRIKWDCICDCGNECSVIGTNLVSGGCQSCGCLIAERNKELNKKYNQYDLTGNYGIGYINNTDIEFHFDLDDYEIIRNYFWSVDVKGYICTSIRNHKNIRFHRLITNCPDDKIVDHINHNILDNRKENLRICSYSQNGMNSIKPKNNRTGIKGICFDEKTQKYKVYISINKKQVHLGYFGSLSEALEVRKNAENKYYKEYNYNEY